MFHRAGHDDEFAWAYKRSIAKRQQTLKMPYLHPHLNRKNRRTKTASYQKAFAFRL